MSTIKINPVTKKIKKPRISILGFSRNNTCETHFFNIENSNIFLKLNIYIFRLNINTSEAFYMKLSICIEIKS